MVEGTGLENRQTRKGLVGSNPTPSANVVGQAIVLAAFFDLPLDCVPLSVPQLFVDRPELKRTVVDCEGLTEADGRCLRKTVNLISVAHRQYRYCGVKRLRLPR